MTRLSGGRVRDPRHSDSTAWLKMRKRNAEVDDSRLRAQKRRVRSDAAQVQEPDIQSVSQLRNILLFHQDAIPLMRQSTSKYLEFGSKSMTEW